MPDLCPADTRDPDEIVASTEGPGTFAVLTNVSGPVAVPPGPVALPTALRLLAPQPNPSRLTTELRVVLPAARAVDARLLDVTGRTVRSLALSQAMPAGERTFVWDGRDDQGRMMPEGIYVFRVRAGREVVATKLVRLR